jgi:hypothetical protein
MNPSQISYNFYKSNPTTPVGTLVDESSMNVPIVARLPIPTLPPPPLIDMSKIITFKRQVSVIINQFVRIEIINEEIKPIINNFIQKQISIDELLAAIKNIISCIHHQNNISILLRNICSFSFIDIDIYNYIGERLEKIRAEINTDNFISHNSFLIAKCIHIMGEDNNYISLKLILDEFFKESLSCEQLLNKFIEMMNNINNAYDIKFGIFLIKKHNAFYQVSENLHKLRIQPHEQHYYADAAIIIDDDNDAMIISDDE